MHIRKIFTLALLVLLPTSGYSAPVPIDSSVLDTSDSKHRYGIGFTVSVAQRPFVGVDDQTTSLPYLSFKYKDLYVEGSNLGYQFIAKKKYNLDFLVTPRFYEVQPSFAPDGELDGISKTKATFFAGLSSQYRSDFAAYTVQLLKDVAESDGFEIVASASKTFDISDSIKLAPTIGITLQDSNLVDHFYGVQSNETAVNRPQYAGQSSLNYNIALTALWNVSSSIQLLSLVKYEYLGSGITDSPIVNEDAISSFVVGSVYRF